MKKCVSILITISLLVSLITVPSQANGIQNARWITTNDTLIYHQHNAGYAECMVYIIGQIGAEIIDVDIELVVFLSNGPVAVATWNDLSGDDEFTFIEYVPIDRINVVYQLSFTATVVYNGVTETISDHFDLLYE